MSDILKNAVYVHTQRHRLLPLWSDPPMSSIPRVQTIPATSPYNCLASLFNILAFQLRLTTCSFFSLLLFTPCSTTPLPNHTATHACVFKQLCPTQHSKRQTQQWFIENPTTESIGWKNQSRTGVSCCGCRWFCSACPVFDLWCRIVVQFIGLCLPGLRQYSSHWNQRNRWRHPMVDVLGDLCLFQFNRTFQWCHFALGALLLFVQIGSFGMDDAPHSKRCHFHLPSHSQSCQNHHHRKWRTDRFCFPRCVLRSRLKHIWSWENQAVTITHSCLAVPAQIRQCMYIYVLLNYESPQIPFHKIIKIIISISSL